MASELKPCPFCGGNNLNTYYCDIEGWIAHIKCDDCDDMIGPMSEYKYESQEEAYKDAATRWNTRPAPAATDTGLVTAMTVRVEDAGDAGITAQVDDLITEERGLLELVTRSQAEELLAAERAKYRDAMEKLVESQRETLVWQQRAIDLKADNAAQAARIKELGDYAREATKAITGLTGGGSENFSKEIGDVFTADLPFCLDRIRERYVSKVELKRLEAKLAAAVKALEPFGVFGDETISPARRHFLQLLVCPEGDEHPQDYGPHFRKARAVLGGKPS